MAGGYRSVIPVLPYGAGVAGTAGYFGVIPVIRIGGVPAGVAGGFVSIIPPLRLGGDAGAVAFTAELRRTQLLTLMGRYRR